MFPRNLEELTAEHIQELIDAEVAESLTLEYKQQLPSGQTEEKKEFLYDVAAMANAAGGHIVYGIVDKRGDDKQSTGIAESVAGLSPPNLQGEITRLENLIRNGIAPRLTGIATQTVEHADGKLLVMRVPRSWSRPHMVTIGETNKFYGRVATGKYPMSVDEIGSAFSEQGMLGETIARWRKHRVQLALEDDGPIQLKGDVKMLFHVIPESGFARREFRETWRVSEHEAKSIYVPDCIGSYGYNADGFIASTVGNSQSEAYGYTQLFRSSGIVEYAASKCSGPTAPGAKDGPVVYGLLIEQQIVQCYKDAVERVHKEGRAEGLYVGFCLLGIDGKRFHVGPRSGQSIRSPKQNVFISPEVFVDPNEREAHPYAKTLLPLVDTMWQIVGLGESPFKEGDEWKPFGEWS